MLSSSELLRLATFPLIFILAFPTAFALILTVIWLFSIQFEDTLLMDIIEELLELALIFPATPLPSIVIIVVSPTYNEALAGDTPIDAQCNTFPPIIITVRITIITEAIIFFCIILSFAL